MNPDKRTMKSDKRTKNELYLLLPVLAGVCWGSGGLFVRPLADAGLDLTTIIFSKSALGIPVTIIAIPLTGREAFKVKAADLPAVVGAGIFGILLLSYAYNAAVLMLSLSLASILLCTAPIFVLILGRIIFGERITKTKIICMIVAFSGCGMMCGLLETGGISWSMVGIIIGIASAVANGMYTIVSKVATSKGYGPYTIYLYSFLFIAIILIPFTDFGAMADYLKAEPLEATFVYWGYLLITSFVPGICYTMSIKHCEAGKTAILASGSEPVSAMMFGIFFYSEIPSITGVAGMVLTIVALAILVKSDGEERLAMP